MMDYLEEEAELLLGENRGPHAPSPSGDSRGLAPLPDRRVLPQLEGRVPQQQQQQQQQQPWDAPVGNLGGVARAPRQSSPKLDYEAEEEAILREAGAILKAPGTPPRFEPMGTPASTAAFDDDSPPAAMFDSGSLGVAEPELTPIYQKAYVPPVNLADAPAANGAGEEVGAAKHVTVMDDVDEDLMDAIMSEV